MGVPIIAPPPPWPPPAPPHPPQTRIKKLRAVERSSLHGLASALQKSTGQILMSFLVKHETFSNFLSPVPLELPRWQNFMALVTMIMSVLVVDVWCGAPRRRSGCRSGRRPTP